MRLDYSEKRVGKSVERHQVKKNKPRKGSSGLFVLLSILTLIGTFGAGVLTGWLLPKARKAPFTAGQAAKGQEAGQGPQAAEKPAPPPPAAPLTFYKTLSEGGGKGAIGSGLNLKKPEPALSAPRPSQKAAPIPAAVTAPPAETDAEAEAAPAVEKPEASGRFVVQIASFRGQQEADKAQAKLVAKGVAAYVMESKLKDNVVWYRLRVGRHLSKAEAEEIAGKAGKGAAVLSE